MRLEKTGKAYGIVLFLLLLVAGLMGPARRAQAAEYGSLELRFDEAAVGAELTLYPVAEYQDGTFVLSGVFENSGVSLYDLSDLQAAEKEKTAEQLAALAQAQGAQGIAKTVEADGTLRYTELRLAYYLLVQTGGLETVEIQKLLVPIPYTETDGSLGYDAVLSPKYTVPDGAALLRKTDDAGTGLAGAVFHLEKKTYVGTEGELPQGAETGQDVGGRFYWERVRENLTTDQRGELAAENLPFGLYRFVEAQAPEGHILNSAPNYVSVERAGQLQAAESGYQTISGQPSELTVVNNRTTVYVYKVDENGNPVAGASLVVRMEDGRQLFAFTTTQEPTELRGIPGGTYILSEVAAPEGYRVAADVSFTVSDAADAVNAVTMTDERAEETNASVTVTKVLVDQYDTAVYANSGVYYVALFEDEARTQRVSDVMALHYEGSDRDSVTFTNLEMNKTYYVGETDESGALLGTRVTGNGVFAPTYPEVLAVTPTSQQPQQQFSFQNVFYEVPTDYYYGGELTVTKKVLRGTEEYNTNEVFYAAIFEDAAHTKRNGDILELNMDGGSEFSITVPVSVGNTADSTMTYYVTETDSSGKPLDNASGLAFTVSVDKTEVTMAVGSTETVTITNRYSEEKETESTGSGSGTTSRTSGGGSGSSGNSGSQVRTGDNTPIALYAGLLAAAAAVILLVLAGKRRRKG